MPSLLTPTQRYAAGALFSLSLHQAQIHQTRLLGSPTHEEDSINERTSSSSSSSSDSVSEDPDLWVHESSGLLRPVFRFLEIDSTAWLGLEETAGSSPAQHHVGAFLRLLSEESGGTSSEMTVKELALSKAVDVMALSTETTPVDSNSKKEKHREYEHKCREKHSTAEMQANSEVECSTAEMQAKSEAQCSTAKMEAKSEVERYTAEMQAKSGVECSTAEKQAKYEAEDVHFETQLVTNFNVLSIEETPNGSGSKFDERPVEEVTMLTYRKKVTVLYELLSACLAHLPEENKKNTRRRNGYDARHRVALRLLATWFDLKWIKVEAMETMVACSAMASAKEQESKEEETRSPKKSWAKWKRGGIIGAAALTGGTLMAITGGLAAPAIAAGFGALAPTLGTLIPVIGAGGFAAAASAAGSVAGSIAVAASFGAAGAGLTGSKMARRTGSVDEFEFKAIGENHNQGRLAVGILVSGLVFEEEDFVRPWEGLSDNLERYALQWESKNLIAVSTAIQDWLTSRLAMEMMKQGAMLTVLSTLLAALAWPATLLAATDFIDSKWTIAVDRFFLSLDCCRNTQMGKRGGNSSSSHSYKLHACSGVYYSVPHIGCFLG